MIVNLGRGLYFKMTSLTGLTLTSRCRRCGNSELRTLARTPVALTLELPPPLPNNLLGYIYLMLEDTKKIWRTAAGPPPLTAVTMEDYDKAEAFIRQAGLATEIVLPAGRHNHAIRRSVMRGMQPGRMTGDEIVNRWGKLL
jgi:hypothetical protein